MKKGITESRYYKKVMKFRQSCQSASSPPTYWLPNFCERFDVINPTNNDRNLKLIVSKIGPVAVMIGKHFH